MGKKATQDVVVEDFGFKKNSIYLNQFKNKSKQNFYNTSKIIANVGVNG